METVFIVFLLGNYEIMSKLLTDLKVFQHPISSSIFLQTQKPGLDQWSKSKAVSDKRALNLMTLQQSPPTRPQVFLTGLTCELPRQGLRNRGKDHL